MNIREDVVVTYLKTHPKFLESYVTGPNVTRVTFQRWIAKRSLNKYSSKLPISVNNNKWLVSLCKKNNLI